MGTTKSAGECWLAVPMIRILAAKALGSDTFTNTRPVAIMPLDDALLMLQLPTILGETHCTFTRSPAAEEPMYGTTAYLPSSILMLFLALDESFRPMSWLNGIRVKSSNTASTTTSALSPSYTRGPPLIVTLMLTASKGSRVLPWLCGSTSTENPFSTCASRASTPIARLSTTTAADPSTRLSAPMAATVASPADCPTIVSPLMTRATAPSAPSITCSRPVIVLDTSASNTVA